MSKTRRAAAAGQPLDTAGWAVSQAAKNPTPLPLPALNLGCQLDDSWRHFSRHEEEEGFAEARPTWPN